MKLIRCVRCNKIIGEVEGKARIKCKSAGCHTMNEIDTTSLFGTIQIDPTLKEDEWYLKS